MKITADTSQRISSGISFCLEFYKMVMSTFLVMFVPQSCGDAVCSVTENMFNPSLYYVMGNVANLVTFLFVLYFYIIELKRENWSITYLDIDHNKSHNNLDEEVENYPKIKKDLLDVNNNYLKSIKISIIVLVINFILSCITIGFNILGFGSINALASFMLLIFMKLYNAFTIGSKSVKKDRIYSAYMTLPQIYNTIDEDYLHLKEEEVKEEDVVEGTDEKTIEPAVAVAIDDESVNVNIESCNGSE